jgi:hypothetical protein
MNGPQQVAQAERDRQRVRVTVTVAASRQVQRRPAEVDHVVPPVREPPGGDEVSVDGTQGGQVVMAEPIP